MVNTVILMAGRGTRFSDLDPERPKPLVLLHNRPLIEWVVRNLRSSGAQRYIFVCQSSHVAEFKLHELFSSFNIDFAIAETDVVTKGAACSALLAGQYIEQGGVVIANSDQYMEFGMDSFLQDCRDRNLDGSIVTMKASGNKWSYIKTDDEDAVIDVKEKIQISDIATTGVYYFGNWETFEKAADQMIAKNDTHNGEFYLAPVYNYLLKESKVSHYSIGASGNEMIGLGTKEDFLQFAQSPRSIEIRSRLFPGYKGILFDLDGVLIDTRDLHYHAFAQSLHEITGLVISRDYHKAHLCGLPTRDKIRFLSPQHSISEEQGEKINRRKQVLTQDLLRGQTFYSEKIYLLIEELFSRGLKIAVCSNSTRETLDLVLEKLNIRKFVTLSLSNNDVDNSKPSPEIYLKAMSQLHLSPRETLIIEDSVPGVAAAKLSGADLFKVNSPAELVNKLSDFLNRAVT